MNTFVAALDAIEDAKGEPFQHRPEDMRAAMCVFVLRGTRPDPSRDAVTVVVLNPEFPPDPPDVGAGFFFTETRDGDDPPPWVERLERTDTELPIGSGAETVLAVARAFDDALRREGSAHHPVFNESLPSPAKLL